MCEFHDSNCNGDMWWTDKCIYFSSLDIYMLVFYAFVFVHCIAFCSSATEALINK